MKNSFQSLLFAFCILTILLNSGCSSALIQPTQPISAPEAGISPEQIISDAHYTIPEAEKIAGFDIYEPTYLPAGVSFEFATYQGSSSPNVTLHFKIVHEQYGDMGAFLQIMQEPRTEAPADTVACGDVADGCELLQINNIRVIYRLNTGGTEELDWYADGFSYRLLRTAGEPNKIYKDELVKIVDSME